MFALLVVLGVEVVMAFTFSVNTMFSKGAIKVVKTVTDANSTLTYVKQVRLLFAHTKVRRNFRLTEPQQQFCPI